MDLPKCQKCNNGLMIPLSDYGQDGASVMYKAWACTNPSLGRGTSIGLLHARCLRDLLREVDTEEHEKLARRFDERTAAVVEPLYRLTLWYDRHRLAEDLLHFVGGGAGGDVDRSGGRERHHDAQRFGRELLG